MKFQIARLSLLLLPAMLMVYRGLPDNLEHLSFLKAIMPREVSPYICLFQEVSNDCPSPSLNSSSLYFDAETPLTLNFSESARSVHRIILPAERETTHFVTGALFYRAGHVTNAVNAWRKVPSTAQLFISLAETVSEPADAARLYVISIQIESTAQAYFELGLLSLQSENVNDALSYLRSALKYVNNDRALKSSILTTIGNVYMQQDQLKLAREFFEEAILQTPNYSGAVLGLARLDLAAGQNDSAVDRLNAALTAGTGNPSRLRHELASIHLRNGQRTLAFSVIAHDSVREGSFLPALELLGDLYAENDQQIDARLAYQQYLRLDPDNVQVQEKLGQLEPYSAP